KIENAKNINLVLEEKDTVAYKACVANKCDILKSEYFYDKRCDPIPVIVELEIPRDAKRRSFVMKTHDKKDFICKSRVDKAIVKKIYDCNGNLYQRARPFVYGKEIDFVYKLNETVTPKDFD